MNQTAAAEARLFAALEGVPNTDIHANLRAALATGRRITALVREAAALRYGAAKLAPQEYFYYRLWDPDIPMAEKRRFVGKVRQRDMHNACNSQAWYASAADKVLWHIVMAGAGLPAPEVLAVTQMGRPFPGVPTLADADVLADFLRRPDLYPLFAKSVAGRFSLSVISADAYDQERDEVLLLGGARRGVGDVARTMLGGAGYLIQRRLEPADELAAEFGPRLWSVRALVLITPDGPLIHRAVAKIATGHNPADNFWRTGNMLGAIDPASGCIARVVHGTAMDQTLNETHPDTGNSLLGTQIRSWKRLVDLVCEAAAVFPGIRTQSWDVALSNQGPVLLEVNYGGDLNLGQLAHGKGALDNAYAEHLRRCGYKLR
jgi:hypothetical protein